MKLFEYDGKGTRFLHLLSTCIVISVAWLIFSVPVFTMGASFTALYDAAFKMHRGEMVHPWRDFTASFKQHFKAAVPVWLPLMFLYLILFTDSWFIRTVQPPYADILLTVLSVLILLLFFITIYIFPMLLFFQGSTRQLLWNALCFSVLNIPYSILMLALCGGTLYLMSRFVFFTVFGLLICPGLIAFINVPLLKRIFRKYLPK